MKKEVKDFSREVIEALRPHTLKGEVFMIRNGHIKVKGTYPSGTHSFVFGFSPSSNNWKKKARTELKRFIRTRILSA